MCVCLCVSPVGLWVERGVASVSVGGVADERRVWEGEERGHGEGGSVSTVMISEAVRDTCSACSSEYWHFSAAKQKHNIHIHIIYTSTLIHKDIHNCIHRHRIAVR